MNKEQTKQYYFEELENYNNIPSMKSFLTRSRKQVEEFKSDLLEALNRPGAMLHGERRTYKELNDTEDELILINKIYRSLETAKKMYKELQENMDENEFNQVKVNRKYFIIDSVKTLIHFNNVHGTAID